MDTFLRGLIAGFIAGIVKDIPDSILHSIYHIKELSFWDYAGVIALNRMPAKFIEIAMAVGFEIMFSTGLGVLFALLSDKIIKTKHYLLLGLTFGSFIWFLITAVIKIFGLTQLQSKNLSDPVITFVMSVAYGLLITVINHRLQKRPKPFPL
jgi:hypothetical protein